MGLVVWSRDDGSGGYVWISLYYLRVLVFPRLKFLFLLRQENFPLAHNLWETAAKLSEDFRRETFSPSSPSAALGSPPLPLV